jgi:hypothetical protein
MVLVFLLLLESGFAPSSSLLLGGDYRAGAADDSLLYLADGRGVSAFEQKAFKRRGDILLAGKTNHAALYGSSIFVGGTRGLARFDAGILSQPGHVYQENTEVEWLHQEPVTALEVSGDRLWFADASGRVYGMNLGEGEDASPLEFARLPVPAVRIVQAEALLYLAADTAGVFVLYLDAGESRARKLTIEDDPPVVDILLAGDKLYLACAEEGLWATQPKRNSLKVISRVDAAGEVMSLELFGDRIAAASGSKDFSLFSTDSPEGLALIQVERLPGTGLELIKAGTDCFVLTGTGIGRMDLSTAPLAGHGVFFRGNGSGHDILIRGEIAVLAAGKAGVQIIDLQDTLSLLGTYSDAADCWKVYLFGSQVYAMTKANIMQVSEIKNPARPEKRTFLKFSSVTSGVDTEGEMLLAAEHEHGVGVWWRCPCGPFKEHGRWSPGGEALDVKIREQLAFVSTDMAALHVIDWSDSANPEELTSLALNRDYERLYLDEDFLFGLDSSGALVLIDVSRPTRPREVAMLELPGAPAALARHQNRLFIAARDEGVHVVDISKPSSPELVGTIDVEPAMGVAISGDRLLVCTPYSVEEYKIQP